MTVHVCLQLQAEPAGSQGVERRRCLKQQVCHTALSVSCTIELRAHLLSCSLQTSLQTHCRKAATALIFAGVRQGAVFPDVERMCFAQGGNTTQLIKDYLQQQGQNWTQALNQYKANTTAQVQAASSILGQEVCEIRSCTKSSSDCSARCAISAGVMRYIAMSAWSAQHCGHPPKIYRL